MLNGVVVVEVVFAWPGVGSLVVRALETRDYPLIQATVLVTAVLAVLVQLLRRPLLSASGPAGPARKGKRQMTGATTYVIDAPEQPRPSAVTARDIARAGATRRGRDSRVEDLGRQHLRRSS